MLHTNAPVRGLPKRGLILLAALLVSLPLVSCKNPAEARKPIRVLFIGNSLTYANNMPELIAALAKSRNYAMEYEIYAPGGYTLAQHASDSRLLTKIGLGNWDYAVLQEQSQMPAYPMARKRVFLYAQKLSRLILEANPRAKIAFYTTMARRNGDVQNARFLPDAATYDGMQKKINEAYDQMARQNNAILVPVGEVWQRVRAQKPSLELYADDIHPNLAGTYLAACVFYSVLFGDNPVGLTHPPQIDENIAGALQKSAHEVLQSRQPAI